MKKRYLLFIIPILFISLLYGCASILMPVKQNVTINTQDNKAGVYVENESIGDGSVVTSRIKKEGTKQVVIQSEDCKDAYYTLLPCRRQNAYWPLFILDIPTTLCMGWPFDQVSPKTCSYNRNYLMPSGEKYVFKSAKQKNIDMLAISVDIKNKDVDISNYDLFYKKDIKKEYAKLEQKQLEKDQKQSVKTKKVSSLKNNDKQIKYEDTRLSVSIDKMLKKTGYIDTLGKVLSVKANTIGVEGTISQLSTYRVTGLYNVSVQEKVNILWRIKNCYGELLDSIKSTDFSGEFSPKGYEADDLLFKMTSDAVDGSFLKLMKNPSFTKYLTQDTTYKISDPLLTISQPKRCVNELSDAAASSVIVKRKDGGHGSGFAITNDGYILTNFHVLAGKYYDKLQEVTVVLNNGEEVPVKIVRYNRSRDIALLKVDKTFETPFKLTSKKSFKDLQEVYTIGAPKSIELSQSVSSGLISNERKSVDATLLQLSMSVNPGNSGGPLFDKSGTLHGVVSSKLVGYATEGIGFAIPSYLIPEYLNIKIKD